MRIFGFEIARTKQAPVSGAAVPALSAGGFMGWIRESFAGAWQRDVTIESPQNVLSFPAVYSCVARISNDIAKLGLQLMQEDDDGIVTPAPPTSPFWAVLRKPNRYQTTLQFVQHWIASKLLHGNTYVLLERDGRGMVSDMYVLDPRLVSPLVASDGAVYYRIGRDNLSGITEDNTLPASEIIHDRMITLWHPLVGVTPLYASSMSATAGLRIMQNSIRFFENMSRPSGILMPKSPGTISDETAEKLKKRFESNTGGDNIGRLAVLTGEMTYTAMATIPAADAQLIEQLRMTREDIAAAFHMPLHKIIASRQPNFANVEALNQEYFSETLQIHIEAIEYLLNEAFGIDMPVGGKQYSVEFDLASLLRMDQAAQATRAKELVLGGVMTPNEGRKGFNLSPVVGGDSVYLQQQNYALEALARRDAAGAPPTIQTPPAPVNDPALPAPIKAMADDEWASEWVRALDRSLRESWQT